MAIRLLLVLLLGSCSALDRDRPGLYVEGATNDLYFIGKIPDNVMTANVAFVTAPLDKQRLPLDFAIQAVSFNRPGDNYYDGTLGFVELTSPLETDDYWVWGGPVPFPTPLFPGTTPNFVGVKIRSMPYEAIRSIPGAHEYCIVEALGLGVRECAAWVDAILQLLVICRGVVGQIIDCHGLNYEAVPAILITGLGQRSTVQPGSDTFSFFSVAGLVIVHDTDGWRYAKSRRVPRRDEPVAPLIYRGPFADPDALAHAIAESEGSIAGIATVLAGSDQPGARELAAALEREVATRSPEPP